MTSILRGDTKRETQKLERSSKIGGQLQTRKHQIASSQWKPGQRYGKVSSGPPERSLWHPDWASRTVGECVVLLFCRNNMCSSRKPTQPLTTSPFSPPSASASSPTFSSSSPPPPHSCYSNISGLYCHDVYVKTEKSTQVHHITLAAMRSM